MHKRLTELFEELYGCAPDSAVQLCGSASNRTYLRLSAGGSSSIGVEGEDLRENRAFVQLARHFSKKRLPVPKILAVSKDYSVYIQEDLGDTLLSDLVDRARKQGSFESVLPLLKGCMEMLVRFQFEGAEGLDFKEICPQEEFDLRSIMFDLNYFKYCFLKPSGLEFDEVRLQDEYERLAGNLLNCCRYGRETFLYRDFQSRNVMVRDGELWMIDFQSGRRGPIYYDLASFIYQVRAAYPPEVRKTLIQTYLASLERFVGKVDTDVFYRELRLFRLLRMLQVLGAYGFRGVIEHKAKFITSLIPALSALKEFISEKPFCEYPYLQEVLERLTDLPKYSSPAYPSGRLVVKVWSFSFKKGIPEDYTGNGGGYVFDCRSTNNPGRYDRYKQLTGLDAPVIKFLEDDGEIVRYLDHIYSIVEPHVNRYLERGFTNLSVAFGCTGGQHRSVYCAEHLAAHLSEAFPQAIIHLIHREQGIEKIYGI